MKLKGLDYLDISSHFSDEELMVQNTARDFGEKEIAPIIEEYYEKGKFNAGRKKMAKTPKGASLIYNPSSAAPGFFIKNQLFNLMTK